MEQVIETIKSILSNGDNTIRLTLSDITVAELLVFENEQQSA